MPIYPELFYQKRPAKNGRFKNFFRCQGNLLTRYEHHVKFKPLIIKWVLRIPKNIFSGNRIKDLFELNPADSLQAGVYDFFFNRDLFSSSFLYYNERGRVNCLRARI